MWNWKSTRPSPSLAPKRLAASLIKLQIGFFSRQRSPKGVRGETTCADRGVSMWNGWATWSVTSWHALTVYTELELPAFQCRNCQSTPSVCLYLRKAIHTKNKQEQQRKHRKESARKQGQKKMTEIWSPCKAFKIKTGYYINNTQRAKELTEMENMMWAS